MNKTKMDPLKFSIVKDLIDRDKKLMEDLKNAFDYHLYSEKDESEFKLSKIISFKQENNKIKVSFDKHPILIINENENNLFHKSSSYFRFSNSFQKANFIFKNNSGNLTFHIISFMKRLK